MDRVQEIFRGDRLIQEFGMKLIEGREGYAKVSVIVEDRFLNAHAIGHGVLLFAVADAAFALSVNAVVDAHPPQGAAVDGVRAHRDRRGRPGAGEGAIDRVASIAGGVCDRRREDGRLITLRAIGVSASRSAGGDTT
jgi:acyl-coenzyme A thioesterase PaaI-like protein